MSDTLTLIEKTAFMRSIPILATIPTEALAELAARAREIHSNPNDVLFERGDPDHGTYLVISGLLQVRRGDALIRVLQSGMAFGELWLGEGERHTYSLVAVEDSHVLNITREDVDEAIQEFPEFGLGMVRALSLRIHELTTRMLDLEKVVARLDLELSRNGIASPALPPVSTEIPIQSGNLFGGLRDPWPGFAERAKRAPGEVASDGEPDVAAGDGGGAAGGTPPTRYR